MNVAIWIANILCAAPVAYFNNFSGATLALGRMLSSAGTKTGYQDAVTPPWVTKIGLLSYGLSVSIIAMSFYFYSAYRGCAAIVVIMGGMVGFGMILPRSESAHYKILIIQSMASRYANYLRDNDKLRAAVMKELLEKAGVAIHPTASFRVTE